MPKLKVKESEIQKQIINYLETLEKNGICYVVRNNTAAVPIDRGNGKKGFLKNGKKGSPDILLCMGGKFVGVEVKSATGRLSPAQKEAAKIIEEAGGVYIVARSLEELKIDLNLL